MNSTIADMWENKLGLLTKGLLDNPRQYLEGRI